MKFSKSFRTAPYSFFLLCTVWLAVEIPSTLSAQNINFPDANFKQALINEGVDTGMDGEISQAEALAVTSLNVSSKSILDLTGIEYFTNLINLYCYQNSLTSLDVSGLTNLVVLYCWDNSLTSLDVSGLINLKRLECYDNSLTSLDVSGLTNLEYLWCSDNSITSLDVSGLINLEVLICFKNSLTSLDVSGLTNLESLFCENNSLTSLDVSGLTNLIRLWCGNNSLTNLDVSGLTNLELLDCGINSLNSLNVSALINLKELLCTNNSLTSLDVSGLTKLERLECFNNSLTSLDVSGLTKLERLECFNNSLTSLDVSDLTNLEYLWCSDNSLTSLDVSGLINLEIILCFENSLASLDVSGLTNLTNLDCSENSLYTIDIRNTPVLNSLDARNNPDLECIVVEDVNDLPNITTVDPGFNNFTTEPCVGSFEGLPILVNNVELSNTTEAALLATLKVAEEACTAGNKNLALSSLTTFALMVSRAQQLGRLTAAEASQLKEATGILKDDIRSGQMDCSSGTPPNILVWISSWFSLDAAGGSSTPDVGATVTVYQESQRIHVSPELRIYPNPTHGRVEFSRTVDQVEVYDMVGQMMTKTQHASYLDLHAYQSGVYVIRLIDDSGERSVHRVVKK